LSSLNELIILEAAFELHPEDPEELTRRMRKLWIMKKATQPLTFQSAGCIFKNPRGMSAGWLIEQAGDDLFLFSSDYPHPEGGRDPLGRFEESLAGAKPEALDKFYCDNFAAMMGS